MPKRQAAWTALFAALFSLCVTMGRRITFAGDVLLKNTENYIRPMAATDLVVFAAVFAVSWLALVPAQRLAAHGAKRMARRAGEKRRYVRFAAIASLCLLVGWLPYILTVAPGNIYLDSLESIGQMLEHGHPTSNHHPMFFTLLVGVFLKIGSVVFHSFNIGVLLFSLFQAVVMIFTIVCLLLMLYHKRVHKLVIAAALAYYMFMPYFPSYAMSMWKDVLYSCMLVLLSLLLMVLYERETADWKWFGCFFVVGVGTMMMRNNGIYVFAASAVLALFAMRRHAKRLIIAAAAALAVFVSLSSLATRVWNVHGDFVENVGIPLQQLGYAVNHDGEFSEEDWEYLYELAPKDVWGYAYRPCLVDPIKWNPFFNMDLLTQNKGQFFGVWLRGLQDNPMEYIDAYLLATHGFWKPFVQNLYGYMDVQMNENDFGIEFMDLFEKIFGFSLMPVLRDYPVIMGSGTLLWLCLLGCVLVCMQRMGGSVVCLPALLNWATVMIATPVAYSLRYVYAFALGLPLYLLLPLLLGMHEGGTQRRA